MCFTVERFAWITLVADPALLLATVVVAGLPLLLIPDSTGLLASAAVVALAFWLNHRLEASVRRLPVRVGPEAMAGQVGVVVEGLGPVGAVRCGGELWRAVEVRGRPMESGQRVRVVRARGLLLHVQAVDQRAW